ncbi:MAG: response regulator [Bacteroidota bacterium]
MKEYDDNLKALIEKLSSLHQDEPQKWKSQLQQAFEKLYREKEYFAGLFHEAPIGNLIINPDYRIKEVNNTTCRLLGKEKSELLEMDFLQLFKDGYQNIFNNFMKEIQLGKEDNDCDLKLNKEDSSIFIRLFAKPFSGINGDDILFQIVFFDVSKEKKLEQNLMEKTRKTRENDRLNSALEAGKKQAGRTSDEILSQLSVLVADDDEVARIYLSELLKGKCKKILYAQNGKEAVEQYQSNGYIDLVLMDIKMPVMDGYTAAIKINELNKNSIIIAQTAYALASDREKALAAGCNDYLAKPLMKEDLFSVIKKFFQ